MSKWVGLFRWLPGTSHGIELPNVMADTNIGQIANGYDRVEIPLFKYVERHIGIPPFVGLTNSTELHFPQALDDWGAVRGYGIFDAPKRHQKGQLLFHGPLYQECAVKRGDVFVLNVGDIRIDVAEAWAYFEAETSNKVPQAKTLWERLLEEDR